VDTSRERDQSVEKLLRGAFVQKGAPSELTDACLDAETIAAWVDGGLSGRALEMADAHLAECDRCQSLVGAVGRAAAIAPQPAQARPDRQPRWWLGWAVPLTAAAAVITVGVAVYRDSGFGVRDAQTEIRDSGAAVKTSPEPPAGQIAVQRAAEPAPQSAAPTAAKQEQVTPQATETRLKEEKAEPPEPTRESVRIDADSARQEPVTLNSTASPEAAAGTAAPPQSAPQEARRDAAPATAAPAAAPPPAAPPALSPRVASLARMVTAQEIASPDPQVRWRIRGAVLEHSVNGGSTWEGVTTNTTAELTAGSAPSSTVCWVVGRAGIVLLSSDGRTWRRVALPEPVDLAAVQATDARTATVTTVDGRTFATADAGGTWVQR
jgi:hypothetical protein